MPWIDIPEELAISREDNRVSIQLVLWIVSIMYRALNEVYGANYSDLCSQSSLCIKHILDRIGIGSGIYRGDVCFRMAYKDDPSVQKWEGFWDPQYHVWVMTEFKELIDITISHLHLHPASSRDDALPIPIIWWQEEGMPSWFLYIPRDPVEIELEQKEKDDFEKLIMRADHYYDTETSLEEEPKLPIPPILMGSRTANLLYQQKNPWMVMALDHFENEPLKLPDLMEERDRELRRQYGES